MIGRIVLKSTNQNQSPKFTALMNGTTQQEETKSSRTQIGSKTPRKQLATKAPKKFDPEPIDEIIQLEEVDIHVRHVREESKEGKRERPEEENTSAKRVKTLGNGCSVKISSHMTPEQTYWLNSCLKLKLFYLCTHETDVPDVLLRCDSGSRSIKTIECMFMNNGMTYPTLFLNAQWLNDCFTQGMVVGASPCHFNRKIYELYDVMVKRNWKSHVTQSVVCIPMREINKSEFFNLIENVFEFREVHDGMYIYNNNSSFEFRLSSQKQGFTTDNEFENVKELALQTKNGQTVFYISKPDMDESVHDSERENIVELGLKQFTTALIDSFMNNKQ